MAGTTVHTLENQQLLEQVERESAAAARQLAETAHLRKGQLVVIGCSTSEVVGHQVGSWSTPEVADAIFRGLDSVFGPMGVYMAAQCCEHLNRALIVEYEAVPGGEIVIQRTTGGYHGYMALILLIGYLGLIFRNLREQEQDCRMPIPWLLAIGILVQFGWEAGLLIGGIRSVGFTLEEKLRPLIINSLLETNLGLPYLFAIYIAVTGRFTEQLRRRPDKLTFRDRLREYHHKEEAR